MSAQICGECGQVRDVNAERAAATAVAIPPYSEWQHATETVTAPPGITTSAWLSVWGRQALYAGIIAAALAPLLDRITDLENRLQRAADLETELRLSLDSCHRQRERLRGGSS